MLFFFLLLFVSLFLFGLGGLRLGQCCQLLMDSFKLEVPNTEEALKSTLPVNYLSVFHQSLKSPTPSNFNVLTCSCNSANRCCLSCSESPLEDSESEELELSSSETAVGGGACRVEGAKWRADDGVGTGADSSESSGILAKRFSNTSCEMRGRTNYELNWNRKCIL